MQADEQKRAAKRNRDLETELAVLTAVVTSHFPDVSTPLDTERFGSEFSEGVRLMSRSRVDPEKTEAKRRSAEEKNARLVSENSSLKKQVAALEAERTWLKRLTRDQTEEIKDKTYWTMGEQMRINVEAKVMDTHIRKIVAHANSAMNDCGGPRSKMLSLDEWLPKKMPYM
jgi:hypothetical protein